MAATPVRASFAYTVTDTEGRPIAGASITVYQVGTTTEITETIYADATGSSELANPFTADSVGQFRFYLDKSKRVDLKVSATGYTAYTLQDVDVVRTGEDPAYIVVAASNAPDWQKLGAHYVCDGTDDDEEIQAALDAGGPVKLTRGLFRPGSEITVDDDALLEGCGPKTIVKASDTFTDDRVIGNENWGTGSGSDNHNITLRGMKVDGNDKCGTDGVVGFKSGDAANRSTNITFEDLWTTGGLGHGLHVAGVTGLTIDNVLSEANGDASGDHNVYLLRCTNLQVGPLFVKDSNAGASYGLKLSTCVQGIVDVIATGNNEDGVGIVGSCKDLQVNAIAQGNGANGIIVTIDSTTPTDIEINAICRGNTNSGLATHGSTARITIRGNYSDHTNTDEDGLDIFGDNHTITGVVAEGNKRNGIRLNSGADNCTVVGNDVTGNDGANLYNGGANNTIWGNKGHTANAGAANTGVTAEEHSDGYWFTTILTVSQVNALTLADNASIADGYLLYTFPAGTVVIDYAYMTMAVQAAGSELPADTPDVGLGTVIASGAVATLDGTGTFEDIITGQTAADADGTATVKTALPTAAVPFVIESGDAHTLHFNVADAWADDTGGDLTADIAGTVVIVWRFLA